jgi:hypothetical protein
MTTQNPMYGLLEMPEFSIFRELVTQNIGYFPKISIDQIGLSGHRVRIFRDPPAVDINYSERALARYIEMADMISIAKERNSLAVLRGGLFALVGGDFIRRNRFVGLAFIAKGFQEVNIKKLPHKEIISNALAKAATINGNIYLIDLLLPLAHEIGHVSEAQALCPDAIMNDGIYETYRINYEQIVGFTGEFDYSRSMADARSSLNLSILREEAAGDFFGVSAMSWLLNKRLKTGDIFPLVELVTGLLIFPLVMALEAISLKHLGTQREIQEVTLAMHCRYSLMIDSVRASTKYMFSKKNNFAQIEPVIDDAINDVVRDFDALYRLTWEAFISYAKDASAIVELDNVEVLNLVGNISVDVRRRLAIADYLDTLSNEVHGYPLRPDNQKKLQDFESALRTFDTIITDGKNLLLR